MLKPFKYPHVFIPNLPEDFLTYLESPVPVLVGVNKSVKFLETAQLQINRETSLIVDLDENNMQFGI